MADAFYDADRVSRIKGELPPWFKPEPGFKFNYDKSPAIVVGFGSWRDTVYLGDIHLDTHGKEAISFHKGMYSIEMRPTSLVFCYRYKGEYHQAAVMGSDLDKEGWIKSFTPITT